MAQLTIERRAAVKADGEKLRQIVRLKELQQHFVSYKSKVEIAVESLRDIARELHQLEVKTVKQKKTGYITSSVGSSVLGGALLGGLLAAGPVLTAGLVTGTVLTSLGGIIVFTGGEGNRVKELDLQVTSILLSLEREFARCQEAVREAGVEAGSIETLRRELVSLERERPGGVDTVTTVLSNIVRFTTNLSSRVEQLPREVRALLEGGLTQVVPYFISPYGASSLVNLLKGDSVLPESVTVSPPPCCVSSSMDCLLRSGSSVPGSTTECKPQSWYSACGRLGKVAYTVGAVLTAYEFYSSVTKAKELSKRLQRLRDSADLLKYEGAAKEVFNIALDLQLILTTVFKQEEDIEEMEAEDGDF